MLVREEKWLTNYSLLKEYILIYGNFPTASTVYKGINLGNWLKHQKDVMRNGHLDDHGFYRYNNLVLTKEQKELLDSIGVNWKVDNWANNFALLCEYLKLNNGEYPNDNCVYKGFNIGRWAQSMRLIYNNGLLEQDGRIRYQTWVLTQEQIKKLDSIGFPWSIYDKSFNDYFNLLQNYVLEYNRFPTQKTVYKDKKLGEWVHMQRRIFINGELQGDGSIRYDNEIMKPWQREKLESINFPWVVRERKIVNKTIKTKGESLGIERFLLYKYRSLLELKKDVNEIKYMISNDMLRK